MATKIHVLSQLPNLASLLRNEISNRLSENISKQLYSSLEIINVQPKNAIQGEFIKNLVVTSEDIEKLNGAKVLLVDNDLLPTILGALDSGVPSVKSICWLQNTWAGVDLLFKTNVADIIKKNNIIVTRFSGPHFGQTMFDYLMAQIVNHERGFYNLYKRTMMEKQWNVGWFDPLIYNYRRTDELSCVVLGGSGAIGSHVCKKLSQAGLKVFAYGRSARSETDTKTFCKNFGVVKYSTHMQDVLPYVDYIISILPSTSSTNNLLDNDTLKMCSNKKPVFINIGRGNVISEQSIIQALDNKWISYAILDVFQVEPLPSTSPLWSRDDVLITPHVAANTRACDVVKVFLDNYANFANQKALQYVVNLDNEY